MYRYLSRSNVIYLPAAVSTRQMRAIRARMRTVRPEVHSVPAGLPAVSKCPGLPTGSARAGTGYADRATAAATRTTEAAVCQISERTTTEAALFSSLTFYLKKK